MVNDPFRINPRRPKLGKPNNKYMYPPTVGASALMTELVAMLSPSEVPVAVSGTCFVITLLAIVLRRAPDITWNGRLECLCMENETEWNGNETEGNGNETEWNRNETVVWDEMLNDSP